MNQFDTGMGMLAYDPTVDYKKCSSHYINRLRVSYTIVYKDGTVESYENVSWRSHGKKLWARHIALTKAGKTVA